MTFTLRPLAIALLGATLAACVTSPDGSLPKAALDDALNINSDAVPLDVQQELMSSQPRTASQLAEPRERRFNIAANNVDAKNFFNALANQHGISVAVHPEVDGTISLNLRQATLTDSLAALSQLYGYGIEHKNGVYQVFPNGVRTKTFNVNYLMLSRLGKSTTAISGSSLSNSGGSDASSSSESSTNDATRISTESNNDFWADLESALSRLIGSKDERVVVTNPQAGLVSVRAAPDELALVEDFLNQAERQLKRQVVLEARIIEVELNDGYEQGIDWADLQAGSSANFSASPRVTGGTANPYPGFLNPLGGLLGGGAVFNFTDGNFSAMINLLQTQGEVNTLSNPRIATSNNQKAVIKVGTDEYFVTNFTLETTTSSNGNTQQSPDIELKPFFSGISLDVTPQISDDNRVLLHIHPTVSEVTDGEKRIDFGTGEVVLPLARSTVRESDTIVEARSGEMIVIGGLMQEKQKEVNSGVPVLSQIPVLGNLFKNRSVTSQKSELVILLRPVVVAENTWQDELKRSRDLLEKWYPEQQPIRSIDNGQMSFSDPVRGIDNNQPMSQEPVRSGTGIISSNQEPMRAIDRGTF
ncbi:pilus (MSHA type) biogenesis protein MshL [Oceanisphaera profunda]|uniref:Pilus (MSHA type) biogenesis protein MshL n=1 Tax=Oceanisphaera profunda TaxID=1416627 RepID=A0A1Y0D2F3_9GAMM|nr:pilus (MSHA type) biogenesis protein MshL [Oceanisphaera profunda]ART81295.1 pilus (MSHA type) biogenesis protein MshL [Oceanisphaera profunda]